MRTACKPASDEARACIAVCVCVGGCPCVPESGITETGTPLLNGGKKPRFPSTRSLLVNPLMSSCMSSLSHSSPRAVPA